jgi:hypothetical protein
VAAKEVAKTERPKRRGADANSMAAMLAESNELLAAYVERHARRSPGRDQMVLVDAKAPADTDQTDYYLVPGDVNGRTTHGRTLQQAAQKAEGAA